MRSLKTILSLVAMLLLGNTLSAQVNYMKQARQYLAEGNCKGARTYYDMAYQFELNGKSDTQFEQQLAECESDDLNKAGEDLYITVNGVSFVMIYVEGGTFLMGGHDTDNTPLHDVTLSGYYICETEVTQALWNAIMDSNPSYFKGDNHPVENVNLSDCQDFIRKLNRLTDRNFRLPTEAEWEYAARGGKKSNRYKYSGSDIIDDVAVYRANSRDKGQDSPAFGTHRVMTKSPNELGLYDMSGNVFEWCSDWYDEYDYGAQTNPKGPSTGSTRVVRGGDWSSDVKQSQVSYRGHGPSDSRGINLGFRLCLSK